MSCSISFRVVILALAFICLTSLCSNYIIINFTFICMKNDFSGAVVVNGTLKSVFDYSPMEKKFIMWAVGVGTVIGSLPVNFLYFRFGAKYPFLAAGLISAIATALIPTFAEIGFIPLLVLRVLQGVAYSADFAAIGMVTVRWAPLSETSIFIAILTSFTFVASVITNSATGVMCETIGWRAAYYIHSIACVVLFAAWALIYTDHPAQSKRVDGAELAKIHKNKSQAQIQHDSSPPYKKIVTSPVVLCVWFNAFAELSAVLLVAMFAPLYFHNVFRFTVAETGFFVALAISAHVPLKLVAAFISDKMRMFPERPKMLVLNSISLGVAGLLFLILGFLDYEHRHYAVLVLMLIESFISFNCGGFFKCGALHAQQYSHVVIGAIQWCKCVALFTAPALVAYFVQNEKEGSQWRSVFLVQAAVMITANFAAYIFFTDESAYWTKPRAEWTSDVDKESITEAVAIKVPMIPGGFGSSKADVRFTLAAANA